MTLIFAHFPCFLLSLWAGAPEPLRFPSEARLDGPGAGTWGQLCPRATLLDAWGSQSIGQDPSLAGNQQPQSLAGWQGWSLQLELVGPVLAVCQGHSAMCLSFCLSQPPPG